jgi:hypothetical protein
MPLVHSAAVTTGLSCGWMQIDCRAAVEGSSRRSKWTLNGVLETTGAEPSGA